MSLKIKRRGRKWGGRGGRGGGDKSEMEEGRIRRSGFGGKDKEDEEARRVGRCGGRVDGGKGG